MSKDSRQFLKPTLIEQLVNRIFGTLVGLGVGLRHNYLLEVQGRKSGRIYSTPVNVLDHNGKRFLVAPRGETQWVRNARAGGNVVLRRGKMRQRYGMRELNDGEKPEFLQEYLRRYKTTVQKYFDVPAGAPIESFAGIAAQYPVFELIPRPSTN
jgi:deazaflavin-dependent oxidoreductase (nitroreductase family)